MVIKSIKPSGITRYLTSRELLPSKFLSLSWFTDRSRRYPGVKCDLNAQKSMVKTKRFNHVTWQIIHSVVSPRLKLVRIPQITLMCRIVKIMTDWIVLVDGPVRELWVHVKIFIHKTKIITVKHYHCPTVFPQVNKPQVKTTPRVTFTLRGKQRYCTTLILHEDFI